MHEFKANEDSHKFQPMKLQKYSTLKIKFHQVLESEVQLSSSATFRFNVFSFAKKTK